MKKETAMKILKELHDKSLFAERTALETIIPELKESEDEKTRKGIIELVKQSSEILNKKNQEQMLAWLEKQGKQKPTEVRTTGYWNVKDIDQKPFDYEHATITQKDFASVGETATIELSSPIDCGDRIYHVSHKPIEKHGEQKHINDTDEEIVNAVKDTSVLDLVEPKFKVGDWVVTDKNDIVQIKAVNNDYYTIDNGMYFNMPYVDRCWHLWTVQDAKDGDVLVGNKGEVILMFRGIGNTEWDDVIDYHCYYDCCHENFVVQKSVEYWGNTENNQLKPATKKQRDTLFAKMKEAGYEWDAEKKELKLLITNGGDFEPKQEWSEKDEKIRKALIRFHKSTIDIDGIKGDDIIAWLEKQGKQKPTSDIRYEVNDGGSLSVVNGKPFDYEHATITQKDFAPEDKCAGCNNIKGCLACVDGDNWAHYYYEDEQKQEWSEEDMSKVQRICEYLDEAKKYYADITEVRECVNWLKSLEDRVWHNSWKPSEEQLDELVNVITEFTTGERFKQLNSLYEHLIKL